MAANADDKTPTTPAVAPVAASAEAEGQITKRVIAMRIEEALGRVDSLKASIEAAPVAKEDAAAVLPDEVAREARAIQFMLKSLAGVTAGASSLVVPVASDLSSLGEITKAVKADAAKVLDEVSRRLTAIKADVDKAALLDATQARTVDTTADMLAKMHHSTSKSAVILATSLSDAQRTVVVSAVEKAMGGLCDVYVALHTDGIVEKAHVADHFQVGSVLHEHTALVEKAVAEMLTGVVRKDHASIGVEHLREIAKALGVDGHDAIKKVTGKIAVIAKAASMYRDRVNWSLDDGDANKYTVELVTEPTPPTKVASFATRTEAKLEALKRNTALVIGVSKSETGTHAVQAGGLGFQVVNTAKDSEVVFDGADEVTAQVVAKIKDQEAAATTDKTTKTDTPKEPTVAATDDKTKDDTTKAGSPMKVERLKRLKAAIKLFKEALGDLQGGAVSMEKFRTFSDSLNTIIGELDTAKRAAAAARGGVDDKRTAKPDAPNMGSGVQPDTTVIGDMSDVMGEGTGDTANVLKADTKTSEIVKGKDAEIARLKAENAEIKKVRAAPSTPPTDGEFAYVEKGEDVDERAGWPSDMNDWTK